MPIIILRWGKQCARHADNVKDLVQFQDAGPQIYWPIVQWVGRGVLVPKIWVRVLVGQPIASEVLVAAWRVFTPFGDGSSPSGGTKL